MTAAAPRFAKRSILDFDEPPYALVHAWPEDCLVQCGGKGIVLTTAGSYRTAFFEAFPRDPDTFLRGEGATIAEAEANAWAKFERIRGCAGHEFERGRYRNGAGICRHCKLFARGVFEPLETCSTCSSPTYWANHGGRWFCKDHAPATTTEEA